MSKSRPCFRGSKVRCYGRISRAEHVRQAFIEEVMVFRGPKGYLKISRTRRVHLSTVMVYFGGVIMKGVIINA